MKADQLWRLTAGEALELIERGETTATEVTASLLKRIASTDGRINAYLTVTAEQALAAAERADSGAGSELGGLPIALKDSICTRGIRTTCGSKMLADYVPPYDAGVVQRLKRAGAGIVGKTNLDEFAMGGSTENSAFGPTINPRQSGIVAGGSSGGSAAAVAAGSAFWALGSDTGGSIREPASFCGIVGLKPSYGRVSRYGLVAFASSLDQIGPMTRNVADCARLLGIIAGHDRRDSTTSPRPVPDYLSDLNADIRGLRVGVIQEHLGENVDSEVRECVLNAVQGLADRGARVGECSLPNSRYGVSAYYLIAPAEASSNLARFDGIRYGFRDQHDDLFDLYTKTRAQGFGPEVKRRIMLGTYALSAGYCDAYYLKGQQVRTLICRDYARAFSSFDVLVGPTCPSTAFGLGELVDYPLQMYMMDQMTLTANLAGLPAISVPCGQVDGLPVGLQVQAPSFHEQAVLNVAYALEQCCLYQAPPGVSGEEALS